MNIAIHLYDNAEVLDFSGAFEVLSTAKRLNDLNWHIFTVAETANIVSARGGLLVQPHYDFSNHPAIDVLILVGGDHTDEIKKPPVIAWVKNQAMQAKKVASVCTGAFFLAEAGCLDGLTVTTHWEDIAELTKNYPKLTVIDNKRWVESDKFITSAGISAGIDMSLYLVSQLANHELALKTARQMDYNWQII